MTFATFGAARKQRPRVLKSHDSKLLLLHCCYLTDRNVQLVPPHGLLCLRAFPHVLNGCMPGWTFDTCLSFLWRSWMLLGFTCLPLRKVSTKVILEFQQTCASESSSKPHKPHGLVSEVEGSTSKLCGQHFKHRLLQLLVQPQNDATECSNLMFPDRFIALLPPLPIARSNLYSLHLALLTRFPTSSNACMSIWKFDACVSFW